jgi:hypothetical protein
MPNVTVFLTARIMYIFILLVARSWFWLVFFASRIVFSQYGLLLPTPLWVDGCYALTWRLPFVWSICFQADRSTARNPNNIIEHQITTTNRLYSHTTLSLFSSSPGLLHKQAATRKRAFAPRG